MLFLKNKDKGNPRACVCIHTYVHACSSSTYTCFMHAYAYTSIRTHVRVPETMKDKEINQIFQDTVDTIFCYPYNLGLCSTVMLEF